MARRRPFDPSRIRVPADEQKLLGARLPEALTVRQVNELVQGAIARHLPSTLHVVGEISDFTRAGSGHLYFCLKDAESELRAVMWRSAAAALKFTPEPGLAVVATGEIDVYLPRGAYQLMVRRLEPRGVGALELAFRQLKTRLEAEGLFDPRRKRPLRRVPARIGIVTSPTGAAIRDILRTLNRRYPKLEILIYPARVQGAGATEEIAAGIECLNAHARSCGGLDALIVGRGGGSIEDLWAFNEEVVARAIFASDIPVISAVGHEIDVTIADFVADVRAATPTAAAEIVAPELGGLLDRLATQRRRAGRALRHEFAEARAQLSAALGSESLARPLLRLRHAAQRIDENTSRSLAALRALLQRLHRRVDQAEAAVARQAGAASFSRRATALEQRVRRLHRTVEERWRWTDRRLHRLRTRLERSSPTTVWERWDERVDGLRLRLGLALRQVLTHDRDRLAARLAALQASDHLRLLRRGYALVRDAKTRRLLRGAAEVRDQQRLIVELSDGEVRVTADDPRQPRLFE